MRLTLIRRRAIVFHADGVERRARGSGGEGKLGVRQARDGRAQFLHFAEHRLKLRPLLLLFDFPGVTPKVEYASTSSYDMKHRVSSFRPFSRSGVEDEVDHISRRKPFGEVSDVGRPRMRAGLD